MWTKEAINDPIKVIIAGPQKSGKSTIANFLLDPTKKNFDSQKDVESDYEATVGCRILEIERSGEFKKRVELWDVSGDAEYENSWAAILSGTPDDTIDGIILVFDPNRIGHREEIKHWYYYFVTKPGIEDEKCMILAHKSFSSNATSENTSIYTLSQELKTKCEIRETSVEKPKELLETFTDFVCSITTK